MKENETLARNTCETLRKVRVGWLQGRTGNLQATKAGLAVSRPWRSSSRKVVLCRALCSCEEAACAEDRAASQARAACLRPCSPGLLVRNKFSWPVTSPLENSACIPCMVHCWLCMPNHLEYVGEVLVHAPLLVESETSRNCSSMMDNGRTGFRQGD